MYTKDEQLQITCEILNQLGGKTFTKMTGAKHFVSLQSGGIQFDLPKTPHFVKDGINRIIIRLNEDDTYTLAAYKIEKHGLKCTVRAERTGIYCDDLRGVFTEITGLDTQMPRIYQIIRRSKDE